MRNLRHNRNSLSSCRCFDCWGLSRVCPRQRSLIAGAPMTISRREVLLRVGQVGGAGAALAAMQLLGLSMPTAASAADFALPVSSGGRPVRRRSGGRDRRVVAAYELQQAGYKVTVLEARDRVGGRAWTIRGNDRIVQNAGRCNRPHFSDGMYFNAGPARIPSWHHAILGYARRFNVPLETFINSHHSGGWEFGGKVHRGRQMVNDLHGRSASCWRSWPPQGPWTSRRAGGLPAAQSGAPEPAMRSHGGESI